jgi:23S rRNA (pseudouridine1915-N3)-methyltransferase
MKINLICVGTRMPAWVEDGVAEYRKRLPRDFELTITEVPLSQRTKTTNLVHAIAKEGDACLKAAAQGDFLVALDVKGKVLSTAQMASRVGELRDGGRNLSLLVGGPDGLAPACLTRADMTWSLSALTFPHPVVRIIVAEQIYRVWSLLNHHPYHRA